MQNPWFYSQARAVIVRALLLLLLPGMALGGGFSVAPLRLDYAAQGQIETLMVRNPGQEAVVVQVEPLLWEAGETEDSLLPTGDLLVSPPIARIEPGTSQLVRVAFRERPDPQVERSYRLRLSEVPAAKEPTAPAQLRMALQISLPVFIAPAQPAQPDLAWSATREADGRLRIEASNAGNGHAKLVGLELGSSGMKPPAIEHRQLVYLLPGQRRQWLLADEGLTLEPGGALWIRALSSDDVVYTATVPLANR